MENNNSADYKKLIEQYAKDGKDYVFTLKDDEDNSLHALINLVKNAKSKIRISTHQQIPSEFKNINSEAFIESICEFLEHKDSEIYIILSDELEKLPVGDYLFFKMLRNHPACSEKRVSIRLGGEFSVINELGDKTYMFDLCTGDDRMFYVKNCDTTENIVVVNFNEEELTRDMNIKFDECFNGSKTVA